jgi:hypothetical protein
MITDFGRHPDYRKKLDVEQLAYSVRSWPGIKYSVSSCKSVRPLPIRVIIIIIFDTSNIKPISDSYSNKIRKWIYSIHTGKRYQNSTFWTLLLLILSTNATHTQNMFTGFYGLLNTYLKPCQRHALGLHGTRIFFYGNRKLYMIFRVIKGNNF